MPHQKSGKKPVIVISGVKMMSIISIKRISMIKPKSPNVRNFKGKAISFIRGAKIKLKSPKTTVAVSRITRVL